MARHTIPRSCLACGETFMVRPVIVARGEGKYCSRACQDVGRRTHGETRAGSRSVEYQCWETIKKRCLNPKNSKYPDYGGRGITVCDKWRSNFAAFLADVGRRPSPEHSIDRFPDNNGNYEPGNTRWATRTEQSRNRRSNRTITYGGETRLLCDWANDLGIERRTLSNRLKMGWSVERALTAPIRQWPKTK